MGRVALILHGWPGLRVEDDFLVNYLAASGYEVIAPNLFDSSFEFSPETICSVLKNKAGEKRVELIIGISLGGLILPHLASKYPKAKLIFIASGPYLKAKPKFFNFLLSLLNRKNLLEKEKAILGLPSEILEFFYQMANPFKGTFQEREIYVKDMRRNLSLFKEIPLSKEKEIVNFVTRCDNSKMLKKLTNPSLIFAGENDLLMPKEAGIKLNKLLKKSVLIVNHGGHFDVFTEKDINKVERFLNQAWENLTLE